MNNKKGSSAVFLTLILATLVSITLALVYGVREEVASSKADAVLSLAGDSILSEFDYEVQKQYGLFLLKGSDEELTKKARDYANTTFAHMEDVKVSRLKVSGSSFSVADPQLIREQILEYMKYAEVQGVIERFQSKEQGRKNEKETRILKHGPTIVSLPSAQVPKKKLTVLAEEIADRSSEVEKAFRSGTDAYLINRYVLSHFNNKNYMVNQDSFFKNEVEYILGGELSDRKNEKRVEMALKAMRIPLNLAHIYADPEKRTAVLTAAQLLTPGAVAAATQLALATTWAYAEADNDVELLWQGHKVPMVKDKQSWATDLDGAIEGIMGGTAKPDVEKGYDYNQYLQILLFFQDENLKIARTLDLIQINARSGWDESFLISEHVTGISVTAEINGREYGYEKKY